MEKVVLKKYVRNHYCLFISNSRKAEILTHFLTDSYDGAYLRSWLRNIEKKGLDGNMISVDKVNKLLVFTNVYDDPSDKFKFVISHAIFSKILNEWEQARSESKEYIVIEVSDDDDVHIYGTDHVEISEEEQSEQKRLREEMYKKINSQEPFKSFSKKKKNIQ